MMTRKKAIQLILSIGCSLVLVTGGWLSHAAIDGTKSWGTIPYRGHLESGGVAVDGTVDLNLSLWSAAASGSKLWEETQGAVPVAAGEFSVRLGSATALNSAVEGAQDLYLAVGVKAPADSTFEMLAGRQALGAVPFALAAKRGIPGQQFSTDGLGVSGDATVTGVATVANLAAQAGTVTGALNAGSVQVSGVVAASGGLLDTGSRAFSAASMFESPEEVITPNSTLSVAHGLAGTPRLVTAIIRCKAPELGYAAGDEVPYQPLIDNGVGATLSGADAAHVWFMMNGNPRITRKDTQTVNQITVSSWRLILRAWY